VSAEPNQATLTEFAKWLQQFKVYSKANIGSFEGQGFGAIAKEEIAAGEPLLIIPSSLLVRNNVIKAEVFKGFADFSSEIPFEPIMIWLLIEKQNEKSPWKPFIDVLPSSFPEQLLEWSEEELAQLQGTGLAEATASLKTVLTSSFENINEKLVKPYIPTLTVTLQDYTWAYYVCISRSWTLNINGETDQTLVPLADMFNHAPGSSLGDLNAEGTYFSFNATRAYAAGEQLLANYGRKSNYELMFNYGFAIDNNVDDSLTLHFSLKSSNLVQSIVEPLLRAVDPAYKDIRIFPNRVPLALLRVFRLSVMEFSELEVVAEALQGKPVSLINELRSYRAAINALSTLYRSYQTTIEEDVEQLKQTNLSGRVRHAITVRKGQKEILKNVILVLGKMWENILLEGRLNGSETPL